MANGKKEIKSIFLFRFFCRHDRNLKSFHLSEIKLHLKSRSQGGKQNRSVRKGIGERGGKKKSYSRSRRNGKIFNGEKIVSFADKTIVGK